MSDFIYKKNDANIKLVILNNKQVIVKLILNEEYIILKL